MVGYISTWFPDAQTHITAAVEDAFPGIVGTGPGQINIDDVVSAKAGAGLIGVLGLLYAGLGCVDSLRVGLRSVFGTLGVRDLLPAQEAGRRRACCCWSGWRCWPRWRSASSRPTRRRTR